MTDTQLALGASSAAWDWGHLPWCWGREDKQVHVFGVQALLPARAVLGLFLFGWALTFLLPLQSIHKKSCRSFTSLNYLLLKDAQWGLLLIHSRDTLCGWTSQQRPLQATSLSFHTDTASRDRSPLQRNFQGVGGTSLPAVPAWLCEREERFGRAELPCSHSVVVHLS